MSSANPNPAYFSRFWIDPANDLRHLRRGDAEHRRVLAGITVSDDGGRDVQARSRRSGARRFPRDVDRSGELESIMIIGVDGGIYASRDAGNNWEHLNQIPIGQAHQVGVRHEQAVSRLRRLPGQRQPVRADREPPHQRHHQQRLAAWRSPATASTRSPI